jgi:hypothetical protein
MPTAPAPAAAFLQKSFVMAGEHMGLDLPHRVHRHADHDQQGGSTEIKRDVELGHQDRGEHADRDT